MKEQLRNSRYAVVGSRVPGFYRCMVDELRFRNEIGPEIVYYSLASMLNDAKNQDNEKVEQRLNEILNTNKVTVEKDMLEKNIRMELALKDFAEREKIDAITMKCWPELQDLYQCAGCAAISALNDSGITACCEGDVTGLVMMDILKKMTGQSVFFADLVSLTQSGGIKAWHCGFGPKGLANDSEDISYVEQATMRNGIGTGVQYTMKQGRLSMCGFSEQDAAYKIFLNVGEGVETDRELLGVQTDICSPKKAGSILDTIIEEGFGQHFALVHTDVEEQMKEFAKWMNIKLITE